VYKEGKHLSPIEYERVIHTQIKKSMGSKRYYWKFEKILWKPPKQMKEMAKREYTGMFI